MLIAALLSFINNLDYFLSFHVLEKYNILTRFTRLKKQ
jgi:hypothetical protein